MHSNKQLPEITSIWEHIENSELYEVEMLTNINSTKKGFVPTICYRNIKTNEQYSRPLSEWNLRFIDVSKKYISEGEVLFHIGDIKIVSYQRPTSDLSSNYKRYDVFNKGVVIARLNQLLINTLNKYRIVSM